MDEPLAALHLKIFKMCPEIVEVGSGDVFILIPTLRVSSKDKGRASNFLAFLNIYHTLYKGTIAEKSIFWNVVCFFFFFFSSRDLCIFLTWLKLSGIGCTSQIALRRLFSGIYFSGKHARGFSFKLILI